MSGDRVVITGVGSFMGYHVARAFAQAGWAVIGTHNTPLAAMDPLRRMRALGVRPLLAELAALDITNPSDMRALIAATRPRLFVHHAGLGANFASARYDLDGANALNLMPLEPIYAGLAELGGAIIITGSGMEYGAVACPHGEDAACWPQSPYGLSRLAASLRARQLAFAYRVPTRIARIYTVFGETDRDDRLVGRMLLRLGRGERFGVAPGVARDVCDVVDVARGYLALVADLARGPVFDIFNLSRGEAIALGALGRLVARELGADPRLVFDDPTVLRAEEPPVISGASAKAQLLLRWAPEPLAAGIGRLVAGLRLQSQQVNLA